MSTSKNNIVGHFNELKKTLLKSVLVVLFIFLPLALFSQEIFETFSKPLLDVIPNHGSMIATNVTSPLFTPLKITLFISVLLSMPAILYYFWCFFSPGLYTNEKKIIIPLVLSFVILFYFGVLFSYLVVLPLTFEFFTSISPLGVTIATDIDNYFSFVISIFVSFGIAFQIPILIFVSCAIGVVNIMILRDKRPHIIVAAFIVSMMLTPPDIISQTMLAVPILILFEIGLMVTNRYIKTD